MCLQALKRSRSFFHTQAMQPILIKEIAPGANVTSDEELLDYIMGSAYQNWHASCTCTSNPVFLAGAHDTDILVQAEWVEPMIRWR